MVQSGKSNGSKDVNPNDIDVYEKIPQENPLLEPDWFKENLGTGEREVVPAEKVPDEIKSSEDDEEPLS